MSWSWIQQEGSPPGTGLGTPALDSLNLFTKLVWMIHSNHTCLILELLLSLFYFSSPISIHLCYIQNWPRIVFQICIPLKTEWVWNEDEEVNNPMILGRTIHLTVELIKFTLPSVHVHIGKAIKRLRPCAVGSATLLTSTMYRLTSLTLSFYSSENSESVSIGARINISSC